MKSLWAIEKVVGDSFGVQEISFEEDRNQGYPLFFYDESSAKEWIAKHPMRTGYQLAELHDKGKLSTFAFWFSQNPNRGGNVLVWKSEFGHTTFDKLHITELLAHIRAETI